jgi:hypothetical protein
VGFYPFSSGQLGFAEKVFRGGRVWGVGCGVWGFTDFQVVSYLIFREKALSNKVFRFIQQTLNKGNLLNTDTKSVEYRLHIRRGTHARGKRENK